MKKVLLILSIVVLAISCQDKTTYKLIGEVENVADGKKVYLCEDLFRKIIVDSTTVKDNRFIFEGKLERPVMLNLKVEGLGLKQEEMAQGFDVNDIASISTLVVLEPDRNIELTCDKEGHITKVKGSYLTKIHRDFWLSLATRDALDTECFFDMIKENKDNAVGLFYFANFIEIASPDSKMLKELHSLFSNKHGQDKKADEMLDYIMNLDNIAAIGTKYTDIKAKTPDSQMVALSDYVGKHKVVLLHFFKWSGLVVDKDYTYLRDAYAKYKDKGFEIVGIWIDDNTIIWKEVIEQDNMAWPQISDKNSIIQIIKNYALFDEPRTILIDKNGIIIDREIPRADLDAKLNTLLQ